MSPEFTATWTPRALAALRIVAAFLFLQHGTAKLFHVPYLPMFDGLAVLSLFGIAGVIEIGGGLLVLLGWFTRPAAFLLSGEMAIAYFHSHVPLGNVLVPLRNEGESAVLFCFVFLLFSVAGAGTWSVDRTRA